MSSRDDSSRLLGGRSYAAKRLPALTLSADADLEQGGRSRSDGWQGKGGYKKGSDTGPAFVEPILREADLISVLMRSSFCA